jgi:hypothetical protein
MYVPSARLIPPDTLTLLSLNRCKCCSRHHHHSCLCQPRCSRCSCNSVALLPRAYRGASHHLRHWLNRVGLGGSWCATCTSSMKCVKLCQSSLCSFLLCCNDVHSTACIPVRRTATCDDDDDDDDGMSQQDHSTINCIS